MPAVALVWRIADLRLWPYRAARRRRRGWPIWIALVLNLSAAGNSGDAAKKGGSAGGETRAAASLEPAPAPLRRQILTKIRRR